MRGLFRNLHLKLMAFMLAFALYAYVSSESVIEETISVQLVPGALPTDHVLISELPTVSVTVRGTSRAFAHLREDALATHTLRSLGAGDVSYTIRETDFQLPTGLVVVDITPYDFGIRLEELVRTELPVQVNIGGEPRDGYEITATRVDPSVVQVDMPASYRSESVTVFTEPVDIDELDHSLTQEVGLVFLRQYITAAAGQRFEVTVEVRPSEELREISNVPIFVTGPTDQWDIEVLDAKLTLRVRGPEGTLDRLDTATLFAELVTADLEVYALPANLVLTPALRNLPEGVELEEVSPQGVRVRITERPPPPPIEPGPGEIDGMFPVLPDGILPPLEGPEGSGEVPHTPVPLP